MLFIDRLIEAVIAKKNPSVVGLDTVLDCIPDKMLRESRERFPDARQAAADAIFRFNRELIDAVADVVPAVKPQLAYYELYGRYGVEAFEKTVAYAADKGLVVIADGKRNDIGSTVSAYAGAYLGEDTKIDALTVNPYLGVDGIEPYLANCRKFNKGVFVLCKTSNASSGQLQDMELANGKRVYEQVADMIGEWGASGGLTGTYGYNSVGAVVGATYPEQAKSLRSRLPRTYFLVPGFGAQGGSAADAAAAFDASGLGAVVNASRSVMRAWSHERWGGKYAHADFAEAARAEALRMKDALNGAVIK